MSSLEQWGPATWALFHSLAAKIRVDSFPIIGKQLLAIIVQIAYCLPCPDCANHAKTFFASFNHATVSSPSQLQNMLFHFHNLVNRRKHKSIFSFARLHSLYASKNLISVYNRFVRYFHTKGNMQMLAESFMRNRVLASLRSWLKRHIYLHFFIMPSIFIMPSTDTHTLTCDTHTLTCDTHTLTCDTHTLT